MEGALNMTAEILGGRRYPIGYPAGELCELAEALWSLDSAGIVEEWHDSAYACQMYFWQKIGLNGPVLFAGPSIKKFRQRNRAWKTLFDEKGIAFSVAYLAGGSNFAKHSKVQAAFAAAGLLLTEHEAQRLSSRAVSLAEAS